MSSTKDIDTKVGVLVTVGIALFMISVVMMGGDTNIFNRKSSFFSQFQSTEGLIKGAKVVLSGVSIGSVSDIQISPDNKKIRVDYEIAKKYADLLRTSTNAEVRTMGVLGDKYIALSPGNLEDPILQPNSEIPVEEGGGLNHFLSQGETLMKSLNSIAFSLEKLLKSFEKNGRHEVFFEGISQTAKNLSGATGKLNNELDQIQIKSAIKNLNQILEKINRGTGTVGALINDPGLYDDLKLLVGEVNRNRIMRNLVRQTIKDSEERQKEEQKKP